MLFVYMVVLFLIFIIQFSVSCAALGINADDEKKILEKVEYYFHFYISCEILIVLKRSCKNTIFSCCRALTTKYRFSKEKEEENHGEI